MSRKLPRQRITAATSRTATFGPMHVVRVERNHGHGGKLAVIAKDLGISAAASLRVLKLSRQPYDRWRTRQVTIRCMVTIC